MPDAEGDDPPYAPIRRVAGDHGVFSGSDPAAGEKPLEPLEKGGRIRALRCPLCLRPINVSLRGRASRHHTPGGEECAGSGLVVRPNEVVHDLPPLSVAAPAQARGDVVDHATAAVEGETRLDVGSHCLTCGKWIPGERSYCGRCLAKRKV